MTKKSDPPPLLRVIPGAAPRKKRARPQEKPVERAESAQEAPGLRLGIYLQAEEHAVLKDLQRTVYAKTGDPPSASFVIRAALRLAHGQPAGDFLEAVGDTRAADKRSTSP